MKKRFLPVFLALCIGLTLLPMSAFAAGTQKSVTVGNLTFSEVLTTDYYGNLANFYKDGGYPTEPGDEFNYDLGMQHLWYNEDPSTEGNEFVGIRTFWCYFLPSDASITFHMTPEDTLYFSGWTAGYDGQDTYSRHCWKTEVVPDGDNWYMKEDSPGSYTKTKADFQKCIPEFDMLTLELGEDFVQVWFVDQIPVPSFTDVPSWFEKEVAWAVEKGVTNGYGGSDTFAPNVECPQAQILTFLWRAAGKPEEGPKTPVANVDEDDYFYQAVMWANDMGMIDPGTFDPGKPCTRSQAVLYICMAFAIPYQAPVDSGFSDVAADAPYAYAVAWAVEKGITNGYGGDTFAPDRVCTRGETAAFLYRAYNN